MISSNSRNDFSFMEKLEDRVLFDAVPDGSFIVPDSGTDIPTIVQHVDVESRESESLQKELIIVDDGVDDANELLASVIDSNPNRIFEVKYLSSADNGISQVSDLLDNKVGEYSAIHIFSHGQNGQVQLGNTSLDHQASLVNAGEIANWGSALTAEGDILIYGCNLASNSRGIELVESISRLTGADVAASDDLTGHSSLGGDWELEYKIGNIENELNITQAVRQNYLGVLAPSSVVLDIAFDGTPTFDANDDPGNDSDPDNGIVVFKIPLALIGFTTLILLGLPIQNSQACYLKGCIGRRFHLRLLATTPIFMTEQHTKQTAVSCLVEINV